MADKLCELKKKGRGELKETTLWTNSSPTSSFASRMITVPDINSFKLIKISFRMATNDATEFYELYTPEQLLNSKVDGERAQIALAAFVIPKTGRFVRYFISPSATSLQFYDCMAIGGGEVYNNFLVPVKVSGLK